MIKQVYKIVSVVNGQFQSYSVGGTFSIVYEINVIALPKKGSIFAFKTLEDAYKFLGNFRAPILICEARVSEYQPDLMLDPYFCDADNLDEFWTQKVYNENNFLSSVPIGTVFCDWVKPITQIF